MFPWQPSDMSHWKVWDSIRAGRLVGSSSQTDRLLGGQMEGASTPVPLHSQKKLWQLTNWECRMKENTIAWISCQIFPSEQKTWQGSGGIPSACTWTVMCVDGWVQKWELNRKCHCDWMGVLCLSARCTRSCGAPSHLWVLAGLYADSWKKCDVIWFFTDFLYGCVQILLYCTMQYYCIAILNILQYAAVSFANICFI